MTPVRSPRPEAQIKETVGRWLERHGVLVHDERPTPAVSGWSHFRVRDVQPGKRPDLLVRGTVEAAGRRQQAYVAVEIKPGRKHQDILDGFDAVLDYFADWLWGARYTVDGQEVPLFAIVLATGYSPEGYLFEAEGKFDPQGIVRGPWDAYPMTFTIARLLWRQRDNILKRYQALVGLPRIRGRLAARQIGLPVPEVGLLVKEPGTDDRLLLMLSAPPYHWHLVGIGRDDREQR